MPPGPRRRARSAVTGRFVSVAYALLHPRETVVELLRRKRPGAS